MKRKLLAVIAVAIPGILAACGGGNSGGGTPTGTATAANMPGGFSDKWRWCNAVDRQQVICRRAVDGPDGRRCARRARFHRDLHLQAADQAIGKALSTGIIDMYWQYTGTELTDPVPRPERGTVPDGPRRRLRQGEAARRGKTALLGGANAVRRHQRHRHQGKRGRDIRQLALGLRHLSDVASEHEGLHPVGVPHSA